MARNTSFSLGDHFTEFIDQQVESGRYATASDVLRAALRMLEDHDDQCVWLRRQMVEAEAQVKAGRVHEDSEEFWAGVQREAAERIQRGDQPSSDVVP
jgi:antitoxin ParD1/3/4